VVVVDAGVVAVALYDDGASGAIARSRMRGAQLVAPELIDIEVTSVLRGRARAGVLPTRRAAQAVADLETLPFTRMPHRPL
jgi:predicted nucleic acid-binding protein